MADVTITIEEITPQIAAKLLEGNTNNRLTAKTRIETYARDMKHKKWRLTGDPIKLNGTRLIDGQHRLLACLMADTPFTTAIARGVSETAHAAIDTGMTRTFAHELRWQGEKHYAALAAAVNLGWFYDNGAKGITVGSRNDHLAWLRKNPALRESVTLGVHARGKIPGIHVTSLAVTHFLIGRDNSSEKGNEFVASLMGGTDYAEGDPCLLLRTYAANVATNRLTRPGPIEWLAVTIKAANFWLIGRPVKQLRWRRVGPQREAFPRIVGQDETDV